MQIREHEVVLDRRSWIASAKLDELYRIASDNPDLAMLCDAAFRIATLG